MAIAVALLFLATAPLGPVSKQNTAADRVAALSRSLGIDFNEKNEKAEHPDPADVAALSRAGFGAWLDAEIQNETDEIDEPAAALQEFLRDRRDALWGVIAALEKDAPEWGASSDEEGINPRLLPIMRLEKMILAAALVEERGGNRIDSGRALEASWSLGRALAIDSTEISQLISVAIEKWQAGALRKMREPSLIWMGRMTRDDPWTRMLDAVENEKRLQDPSGLSDAFSRILEKARQAIVDGLRKISPCDLHDLTNEDVWQLAVAALPVETSSEAPPPDPSEGRLSIRDVVKSVILPNLVSGLRRASRMSVDRELSLRVLRLKLEKETSPSNRWPDALADATSAVCPGAMYSYRVDSGGDGDSIRRVGRPARRRDGASADISERKVQALFHAHSRADRDADARSALTIAAVLAIAVTWAAGVSLRVPGRNATAQLVAEQSVALGLSFRSRRSLDPHPSSADRSALARAGFGDWLEAQIQVPDDSIAEPPAPISEFLRDRHDALWSVIGALERGVPEWPDPDPRDFPRKELVPMVTLARILFCEALIQEKTGHRVEAGRALEASWSLWTAMGSPPSLVGQLSGIRIARWQAGVLRKMKDPPAQWIDRLSRDLPWQGMFDVIAQQYPASNGTDPPSPSDAITRDLRKVYRATADRLRKQSPCAVSRLTDHQIWRSVSSEARRDPDAHVRANADFIEELLPTFTSAIRRTARVVVEQELTAKILALRQDVMASREKIPPQRLHDSASHVCPDAAYAYATDGRRMEIRFEGSIGAPENATLLPLAFHAGGAAEPASTPTPPQPLTQPASGAMIRRR